MDFWEEFIRHHKNNPKKFCVAGTRAYYIGPEDVPRWDRGFCGKKFTITFLTGEVVVTHNLFFKGDIPIEYLDVLEPNCVIE